MSIATKTPAHVTGATRNEPRFVFHPSFEEVGAEASFGQAPADVDENAAFMPDDITRNCSKRMHYAAWRACGAATNRTATRWRRVYLEWRDRVVLGNRKLTYKAVHKWGFSSHVADDMAGECQIVLIKVAAAYNPWLGVRFSTYAFTCLMRALSRLSQRHSNDRLSQSLSLDSLPYGEPCPDSHDPAFGPRHFWLEKRLRHEDTLLTPREKLVLTRRFRLDAAAPRTETLEQVGRDLGLSKERVRQVQHLALGKLREAMQSETQTF